MGEHMRDHEKITLSQNVNRKLRAAENSLSPRNHLKLAAGIIYLCFLPPPPAPDRVKRSYFGESTQPLGPLYLWQCFLFVLCKTSLLCLPILRFHPGPCSFDSHLYF